MASQEPIAIVGSGCRFPGWVKSPSSLWKLLESPRDVAQDIPQDRFDTTGYYHPDGSHHGTTNVRQAYLLRDDLKVFDAAFFNISPNEADSIDPQQRLLLETVYEALEAGGHTIEGLRGSDTAVYVGTMGVDYYDALLRDINAIPTHFATGTNRAIISNRVSYFFDWHGPSMTIDTACSSSLIAVHQGVQALRSGESRVALACGTQVILGPELFVAESKMNMLSPTGRSRMWDADADGYARGEGVAAIVLKRLSDAIADGDHIECLIRGTGANQDGHSTGITVPSTDAQTALIRQTYARAGLDPGNPRDRPQFFEAHGTGTKAGDPKEAAAISRCFGSRGEDDSPLYVGSVKTIIGHTEGTAGLAGLLKGSQMIQKGSIAPNLLFSRLNPSIEPYYNGLQVPTQLSPWPRLSEGVPRRVSVNSFGFGGSNAHAILEEYRPNSESEMQREPCTPFVFSALTENSLVTYLEEFSNYLKTTDGVNLSDLAWTLQSRRSQLPTKAAFSAASIDMLVSKIDEKLAAAKQNPGTTVGLRSNPKLAAPRVLGVFTGQGAQWAAMGKHLICSSAFVRKRVEQLENALATLPLSDRPAWRLVDEMLADADSSRIAEAELSQPLCTAVQILLVDLLQAAGIDFKAVVGHSSGEIGAAYAAGFLSDRDALRVAYYRGLYARLAGNENTGQKGAMLAVGTSWEDAQDLISLRAFKGRLMIAAHNSSASVTLSGDADAVILAKKVFDEEKKFARMLKVDTAYHSHHMVPCGDPYVQALRACGVQLIRDRSSSCAWFSSVVPSSQEVQPNEQLGDVYWRDNMTNAVLFADAVKNAAASDPQLNIVLEIGPHPALKGPATQNIADVRQSPLPYSGVLSRGKNDVEAFVDALGFFWTQFGSSGIDLQSLAKTVSPDVFSQPKLVTGLPSYQWNHERTHWNESRKSQAIRARTQPFHELLGVVSPDSTGRDMRWTNILKVSEISWLDGHQLQSQTVFPAAGYVAMALEAARGVAAGRAVEVFELHDLNIPRAITFEEDNSGVETLVTLTGITNSKDPVLNADFSCYSCPVNGSEQQMELMASGCVRVIFGTPDIATLSSTALDVSNMATVDADRFYSSLSKLGYGYSGPFRGMSSMKRRLNQSSVLVDTYPYAELDSSIYLVHPTMLDVSFQASMLAYSAPGDERLWSLHVPTSIRSIRVNPEICASLSTSGTQVPVCTLLGDSDAFYASIDLFGEDGHHAMVQVEDLNIKPFAPATEADDRHLFSYTKWDFAAPDGASIVSGIRPSIHEVELASACERVSYYYLRQWKSQITEEEWMNAQPHHSSLRDYMDHTLSVISSGQHPFINREWSEDTPEDIKTLLNSYPEDVDLKLLSAVGDNIPAAVRGQTTILEHMLPNNMLDDFYREGLGFRTYNTFLAGMLKQLSHRYPHAKILEIGLIMAGAGTGGATTSILENIGNAFSSYTYTDISVGFFDKAADMFSEYRDKMIFKVLDIEKSPSTLGYEPHSYDIVIASNVLHATASLQQTLENTRELLKPGGYLMLLELTNNGPVRFSNIMGGLPGWWLGVDDGRKYAPTITPGQWHSVLRRTGFAGLNAITPQVDVLAWPFSIMGAQAVDDRVDFLRRPLAFPAKTSPSVRLGDLVILGGSSLETMHISEEVSEYLGGFCDQITILDGLPNATDALTLSPMTTFINLVDLDSPIFKNISFEKMEGLRRLFDLAKRVLWITVGAQADNPYHMASISFSRAMSHEAGHISLNHLDFSDLEHNVSKTISESLLRQCALDEWSEPTDRQQQQQQTFLWSRETESYIDRGQLKIPRLVDNAGQNSRLNSSRRLVTRSKPMSCSDLSISLSPGSAPSLVEEVLSVDLQDCQQAIRVESSSLLALHVAPDTFLYLGLGTNRSTGEKFVTLSTSNSRETAPVAKVAVYQSRTASADGLLVAVASELLATSVVEAVSPGSSLVVHCSERHRLLAAALSRKAVLKNVRVTFTCDAESIVKEDWIRLNARAPRYAVQKLLSPVKPTHFLDLTVQTRTHSTDLSARIREVLLLEGCKQIHESDISRLHAHLSCGPEESGPRLEEAVSAATSIAQRLARDDFQELVVRLDQIQDSSVSHCATSVVNWPLDGHATVEVRPLESKRLFSPDKTYLLVGLSGEIGRSLCEWMVSNNAGCVCLTSRNPKINKSWLESFEKTNATVKVFAMDVTDKRGVESVVNEIRATCPPIAGVANGAMVLHDSLLANMSLGTMQEVLGPKIDGSNNLDQIFHEDNLDFFIMLSSSASVIGNSGQSNYAAANGYLGSLARQRRRRGLAASALDIGRVAGIGYIETAGQAVMNQLSRFGLMSINESEFRQMFAETIWAGYPTDNDTKALAIPQAVVTTGIRKVRDDERIKGPWFENTRFSHCIVETKKTGTQSGQQNKKTTLPVGEQLSAATKPEQAVEVLEECFASKLRMILQLPDQTIDRDLPLVELGLDSLVAVEVRSWFLKELKVDIPVLKVVGGASLAELCQLALKKLPDEPKPASVAPVAPIEPLPKTVATRPSSSTSENDSTAPSVLSTNEDTTPASSTQLSSRSASPERAGDPINLEAKVPPEQPSRKTVKSELMSFGQSRFWFLRRLLEDQTTSNVAFYYHIAGNLRIGDMEKAVQSVTARHEALRTRFVEDQNEADQAFQQVMESSPLRLTHKKISSVDDVAAEYAELQRHVFDLESGDMVRLVLLSLSPTSHYILVNYHHIVMDGVSFQVFLSDLEKAYSNQSLGAPPRQFPDYSAAQRKAFLNGEMNQELAYWRAVFPADEQPPVLPLLPMAKRNSRVPTKDFAVHQVAHRVDSGMAARIKSVSKAQRSTPFHFYLAAYKAMLFSFTDAQDLTIGIADANRNDSDVIGSIGFFLNLLALRFRRQPEQQFVDAIVEARNTTYGALGNSRLPFDVLLKELNVARSSSYSPFFQAFFDYRQGAQEKHAWGNTQFEFQEVHPGRTAYDITLDITDNAQGSFVMLRAQKGLYDPTAASLLLETYIHFLNTLSENARLSLDATPLFSEKQLTQATQIGRGLDMVSDWPKTLPHRIDQIAQESQAKVALMDGIGSSLTYSSMISRIEAIGEALQSSGIGAGSRVLVFQQASSQWICSMLAIMRIGGVYVPLDLRNPMPRLAAVANDCNPSAVLVDDTTHKDVEQLHVSYAHVLDVSHVGKEPSTPISNAARADSPAAILYTSGSTGTPKGIVVTHAGLRNEIEGYTKTWKLGAERTLQQSAYTFNHSSDQIYTGLVNGGMVYTVPCSKRGDPLEITKILQEHSITYTKATPSEYSLWMQYGGEALRQASHWCRAFGGGEALTSTVTREFADLGLPQLRIFNSYGPTEITISSTKTEVEYRDAEKMDVGRIPCGYSLPNYFTYVVDQQLKPLPAGMPGEICLGGAGVSRGYINNQELTDKHFVSNPFASPADIANGWARMYRTGDIGHLQDDGALVFHNRTAGDTQVKIRGLRIELCDIESNIIAASGGALRDAVVTLREGSPDFLVAHVVFAQGQERRIPDREGFLKQLLSNLTIPQYMVPVAAIPLEAFPLTSHSKVDRKAMKNLPLPKRVESSSSDNDEELTETMLQLKKVWQGVLGDSELQFDITPSSSFFLVGGNSLLVIRLQARIRERFNVVVRLVDLLDANTLGHMARKIEESLCVETIDWEHETMPPSTPSFLDGVSHINVDATKPKIVLVTGATGYLARHLLPKLVDSPDIETIHCVAVREKASEKSRELPGSPKIVTYNGDLTLPLLGLHEDEFRALASQVDVILHMGAVRSFWDNYHVLRASNVHPTKELVKLATPRQVPIHYISTVGVLPWGTTDAVSAAEHTPALDGTNGYVSSRWASERVLERSSQELGLETFVYRFLPSSTQVSSHNGNIEDANMDDLVRFVDISGQIPDTNGWHGRIDMMPADQAASWLSTSLVRQSTGSGTPATEFMHSESPIAIDIAELGRYIDQQRGHKGLERVPGLKWMGRIKALGFEYFLTTQEATVNGKNGAKFESRR